MTLTRWMMLLVAMVGSVAVFAASKKTFDRDTVKLVQVLAENKDAVDAFFAKCASDLRTITRTQVSKDKTLYRLEGEWIREGDLLEGKGELTIESTQHRAAEAFWRTYKVDSKCERRDLKRSQHSK